MSDDEIEVHRDGIEMQTTRCWYSQSREKNAVVYKEGAIDIGERKEERIDRADEFKYSRELVTIFRRTSADYENRPPYEAVGFPLRLE